MNKKTAVEDKLLHTSLLRNLQIRGAQTCQICTAFRIGFTLPLWIKQSTVPSLVVLHCSPQPQVSKSHITASFSKKQRPYLSKSMATVSVAADSALQLVVKLR